MTKITKEVLFTELSIKLAIMDAKLDKLIELAMKPNTVNIVGDVSVTGNLESITDYDLTKPYGFDFEPIQRKINKELQGVYDAYKKVEK